MTSPPVGLQQTIRFGEDFELDVRLRRLRRGSHVLKLERIPLEMLVLFLEHPEEVVTRDEIVARVWGSGVFLDTDNSIRGAIRKLRHVLKDDAEAPRFIQTVTGQGYRFIAPIIPAKEESFPDSPKPKTAETAAVVAPLQPYPRISWRLGAALLMIVLSAALLVRVVLVRRNTALASGIGEARIMVGVTPVRNLSSEPGQEYLADGLTDEILTQLGQLNPERLGVVKWVSSPLPSAAGFVQDSKPSPQYVMEGSVRREHERARVSVRLMRVSNATILWSDSFDRNVGDVLALQSEIAQRIGRALQIQVLPQKVRKPKSQEVVEAYLRGRFEMSREDKVPDGARVYLERAIALDPSYAPAYAGLADFYRKRAIEQDFGSDSAWRLAAQYAAQALALDDDSSETHVALAQIKLMHDWDWRAGRQHALRALQLNPSSPDAHAVYARYLTIAGNLTDAINQREQAVALDPFRPDLRDELFIQQYFARDYQAIAAKSQRVLQEDPNSLSAHASLCVCLTHLQLFREAVTECSKELALEGHEDWVSAYVDQYRKHGFEVANSWRARKQLDETLKAQDPDFWDLANAYVLAGKREQAMEILFRGLPSHEPGLLQIRVDPDFDAIRDHPRYTELVARIGFPAE